MTHTADPQSGLGYLCTQVASMKPGECFRINRYELNLLGIGSYFHNGAEFTPADRVLGNIIGSMFTHSYNVDAFTGDIIFRRHEDTGEIRYKDPDRR